MAWESISSLSSPTSGTFIFTGLTLTAYRQVCLMLSGVTVTTDGTDIKMTYYVSGSEVTGTSYAWVTNDQSTGSSRNNDDAAGVAAMLVVSDDANWDVGNASTKSYGGNIYVGNPGSTAFHKISYGYAVGIGPTGNVIYHPSCGIMTNAGAIDGFKIAGTSNLVAGQVRLWGIQ